jgi:hypothetical protein
VQINSVIDKPEDMSNVQAPITPEGILDNTLLMFDHLSEDMKDQFIQRYKGRGRGRGRGRRNRR